MLMTYQELSSKKRADLLVMLAERKEEIRKGSFTFGQTDGQRAPKTIRKEIAQIKTALRADTLATESNQ